METDAIDDPRDEEARAINRFIGKRIKAVRVSQGHSQEALGRVLGLTFQQVQKYERGSNKISADKLWRLATHYHVELAYFFQDIPTGEPAGDAGREPHERLRLEIGREAQRVSPKLLRAVLNVMRSSSGDEE